ncbi:hypothetical protein C8J57DRAFT_1226983 [Mycena rebaudengoi]|nr:hypothetical protein C8J57DRAFT_1226983 [Mycena rebaudengoi]
MAIIIARVVSLKDWSGLRIEGAATGNEQWGAEVLEWMVLRLEDGDDGGGIKGQEMGTARGGIEYAGGGVNKTWCSGGNPGWIYIPIVILSQSTLKSLKSDLVQQGESKADLRSHCCFGSIQAQITQWALHCSSVVIHGPTDDKTWCSRGNPGWICIPIVVLSQSRLELLSGYCTAALWSSAAQRMGNVRWICVPVVVLGQSRLKLLSGYCTAALWSPTALRIIRLGTAGGMVKSLSGYCTATLWSSAAQRCHVSNWFGDRMDLSFQL